MVAVGVSGSRTTTHVVIRVKRPRSTTRTYDKIRSESSVAHKDESGLLSPIRGKGCNAGALDVTQR